jgi:hypothetical protein
LLATVLKFLKILKSDQSTSAKRGLSMVTCIAKDPESDLGP